MSLTVLDAAKRALDADTVTEDDIRPAKRARTIRAPNAPLAWQGPMAHVLDEMLWSILSYLTQEELVNVGEHVCGRWRTAIRAWLDRVECRPWAAGPTDAHALALGAAYPNLTSLSLARCAMVTDGVLPALAGALTRLRSLDLYLCPMASFEALRALPLLHDLRIGGDACITEASLATLPPGLRRLRLESVHTVASLAGLHHLKRLEFLRLYNMDALARLSFGPLKETLRRLNVECCPALRDAGFYDLFALDHLEELALVGLVMPFRDPGPARPLMRLRRLVLHRMPTLHDSMFHALHRAFPRLEKMVVMSQHSLTAAACDDFAAWHTTLRSVTLRCHMQLNHQPPLQPAPAAAVLAFLHRVTLTTLCLVEAHAIDEAALRHICTAQSASLRVLMIRNAHIASRAAVMSALNLLQVRERVVLYQTQPGSSARRLSFEWSSPRASPVCSESRPPYVFEEV